MFRKTSQKISRIALAATALTVLVFCIETAQAQSKKKSATTSTEDITAQPAEGEVDISDVQNQYWKAHDKQFEVVQNKLYTKAGRFELSALFGIYQRVDFQDSKTLGGSLAYHLNDMWGFEFMAYSMLNEDSRVVEKFKATRGATIEFNEEKNYLGGHVMFSPIYGKFSFLGKKISHFDLYISPGFGVTKTTAYRPTPTIALGQKFWISNSFNVRLEYRFFRYTDRVNTNEGATAARNGGPGYYEDTVNVQNLLIGISYLF